MRNLFFLSHYFRISYFEGDKVNNCHSSLHKTVGIFSKYFFSEKICRNITIYAF